MKFYYHLLSIVLIAITSGISCTNTSAQNTYNGIYKVSDTGRAFTQMNDSAKLYVDNVPLISLKEFKSVNKKYDRKMNQYELLITLSESGAETFAEVSKANIGKQLAIIIDDKLLTAPVVQTEITGGELLITGLEKDLVKEIVEYFKRKK